MMRAGVGAEGGAGLNGQRTAPGTGANLVMSATPSRTRARASGANRESDGSRVCDVPSFALYPQGGLRSTTYFYRDAANGR